jgi:hypothetical protein
MCSTIPMTSITAPIAAMAQPRSPEGMPKIGRPSGLAGGAELLFWMSVAIWYRPGRPAQTQPDSALPAIPSGVPWGP